MQTHKPTTTYFEKLKDPRWQKKRLEILERDKWTCRECESKTDTLQVHHLKYTKEPWDAPEEHLLTLCDKCHKDIQKKWDNMISLLCGEIASMRSDHPSEAIEDCMRWLRFPCLTQMSSNLTTAEASEFICEILESVSSSGFAQGFDIGKRKDMHA